MASYDDRGGDGSAPGAGGDADHMDTSPSLAVRLMQVAGEFELDRKRERQRWEEKFTKLQEHNRALDRKNWTQTKQIEALSHKLAQANLELENRSSSDSNQVDALTQELIAVKFELAERELMIQRLRDGQLLPQQLADIENVDPELKAAHSFQSLVPGWHAGQPLEVLQANGGKLANDALPTKEELVAAAAGGLEETVRSILNPPVRHSHTLTQTFGHALLGAAGQGHVAIVKRLLSLGADASVRSLHDGLAQTALHTAAAGGQEEVVRLLIAHRNADVDVNDADAMGNTSLHLAARGNHASVVKHLLLNGADPALANKEAQTAAQLAKAAGTSARRVLEDKNMLFWNSSVRANKEYNDKNFGGAITAYTLALELAPQCSMSTSSRDLATLHYNRARAAYRLGQHCRAVEDCTDALDKDPTYRNAIAQRAECYMSLFDFARAARDFQALLDSDPADRQWARRLLDARAMRDMTHYQVLGLFRNATPDAIRKSYRKHCLKWHPDKHHASDEDQHRATTVFRRINEAHEVLKDSYKRMVYDMETRTLKSTGIQSDGFDRWHQKERERESERIAESERVRATEAGKEQQRSKRRASAVALAAKLRRSQANAKAKHSEHLAEERVRQAAAAEVALQGRQEAASRARAAVARAESELRRVEAQAVAHDAAGSHMRQRVRAVQSDASRAAHVASMQTAKAADMQRAASPISNLHSPANGPVRTPRPYSAQPSGGAGAGAGAGAPPHTPQSGGGAGAGAGAGAGVSGTGGAAGDPLNVSMRSDDDPPLETSPLARAYAARMGDDDDVKLPRAAGDAASAIKPGLVSQRTQQFKAAATAAATNSSVAAEVTSRQRELEFLRRQRERTKSTGSDGSPDKATSGTPGRVRTAGGQRGSRPPPPPPVPAAVRGEANASPAGGGDYSSPQSAYFDASDREAVPRGDDLDGDAEANDSSDGAGVGAGVGDVNGVGAPTDWERERQATIARARRLARRAEAEKQRELERQRTKTDRERAYERAAGRVVAQERQRARELEADRQRMHARQMELKRQVELELKLEREGVLDASSDLGDGNDINVDDLVLSGSDDEVDAFRANLSAGAAGDEDDDDDDDLPTPRFGDPGVDSSFDTDRGSEADFQPSPPRRVTTASSTRAPGGGGSPDDSPHVASQRDVDAFYRAQAAAAATRLPAGVGVGVPQSTSPLPPGPPPTDAVPGWSWRPATAATGGAAAGAAN